MADSRCCAWLTRCRSSRSLYCAARLARFACGGRGESVEVGDYDGEADEVVHECVCCGHGFGGVRCMYEVSGVAKGDSLVWFGLIMACRFTLTVALFGMLGTLFMVVESENGSVVEEQRKMMGLCWGRSWG